MILKKKNSRRRPKVLIKGLNIALGILLLVLMTVLFVERGVVVEQIEQTSTYLDSSQVKTSAEALASVDSTVLAFHDSSNLTSSTAIADFRQFFVDLKVGVEYIDLAQITEPPKPDYNQYESIIILTPDLEPFEENILDLMAYVKEGGNVMFAMTLQKDSVLSVIETKLGIINSSYEYKLVDTLEIHNDFMLGSSRIYTIDEPFESARSVFLSESATVYLTTADANQVPLVWSYRYGKGTVVVDNIGIYGKAYRGFYAASFSLMSDVGAYPVINASSFTLDDFPSPEPSGDSSYVTKDFDMDVSSFYRQIWWPDMQKLAEKYGIKYTGVLIFTYTDDTSGKVIRQSDSTRFIYYGNQLLNSGGEIAYHGYNHQPLVLKAPKGYYDEFSYHVWDNEEAMISGIDTIANYIKVAFPDNTVSVYVPPSNILSADGRAVIVSNYPEIKTIASNYFKGNYEYSQEFEVSEDGVIEAPRITSGGILDDYNKIAAVSELNMHYVSHHFVHPDDALDVDRGANLGWKNLYANLDSHLDWLHSSAPKIRNMLASQLGGAIQRFSSINVTKTISDDQVVFELGNFVDEAYLMVRVNQGNLGNVDGGYLEHLTGDLYLLHASAEKVTIQRTKG